MSNLKAKLKKQGGFTLMEMLIVVAIVAILIAISIPMFNAALERAREATDAANERAAKAEILTCYMLGTDVNGESGTGKTPVAKDTEYSYNAGTGKLVSGTASGLAYGKCAEHKGEYVKVKISDANVVSIKWSGDADTDWDKGLCMDKVTNK